MSDEVTERDAETLGDVLRKCRVADGSPARLLNEGDVNHVAHMLLASDWYAERIAEARREGAAEVVAYVSAVYDNANAAALRGDE